MPGTPEPPDPEAFLSFRRQETMLTILSLLVLAALLAIHVGLSPLLGVPSRSILWTVGAFFVLQTVELLLLQGREVPLSAAAMKSYSRISVWSKLLFAFAIALLGGFEDSHYTVLMVLPIAAAAFRFRPVGVATVALAAVALTFGELALFYRRHPPPRLPEFYEAATLALTYFVVAAVVAALAGQNRADQARLRDSLAALEEAKDRLVRDEKLAALGRLSSAIAHEIRNPVTMIASSARLMAERPPGDPAVSEMRAIVLGEAGRLEKLTTDFLSYAHVREPQRREIATEDALATVADVARARAHETGKAVRVAPAPDGVLFADPHQLQQALLDLVVNALDACPDGGIVTLAASRRSRAVVLSVENPGEPIPPDAAAHLFEPFFTTKPRGTGLGLAIARGLARANGGDVTLARNEPGSVVFELTVTEKDG